MSREMPCRFGAYSVPLLHIGRKDFGAGGAVHSRDMRGRRVPVPVPASMKRGQHLKCTFGNGAKVPGAAAC
jgi:hypothetical protein